MAAGIFTFGHIAGRVARRPAFLRHMAGAAVMVVAWSRLTTPVAAVFALTAERRGQAPA